jgi:hypothetical protein
MAGALTISTLNNDTGVLATQNGMTGIAKAWVNFDGTGTPSIRGSFNVSSITDNGTGDYTLNFTTAMPNANYAVVGTCQNNSQALETVVLAGGATPLTTTTARIRTVFSGGYVESPFCLVAIFSS